MVQMAAQAQAHREREAAMQADIDGKAVQIEEVRFNPILIRFSSDFNPILIRY